MSPPDNEDDDGDDDDDGDFVLPPFSIFVVSPICWTAEREMGT